MEKYCSCGCNEVCDKNVLVEYLYLDLDTCDRCIGTDIVLDEVMEILTPTLSLAGYEVLYNKIEIKTSDIAIKHRFITSPTIRVNGNDICRTVSENSCGCCSDISGTDVDCRIFEYMGVSYEVPPKEMLTEEILKAVFLKDEQEICCNNAYELPGNLKNFFEGKKNKGCSCGSNCC